MQLDPEDGQEKQAGGEIFGRLAELLSRPFVGANRGTAINRAVQSGLTKAINQPAEWALRKSRIPNLVGKAVEVGMTPIPHTPKFFLPVMDQPQRAALGKRVAEGYTDLMASAPEAMLIPSPDPISGKLYIGAKKLFGKAIGAKSLLEKKAMIDAFSDELEKIAWKDHLPGGLADKKKPSQFNPRQLKKGKKVELEHVDNKELATEIAMDHLTEDPAYYDKLSLIEKIAQVSPYQQATQWTCSAACLKAVLGHYNHDIPEELAVQAIGAREGRGAECDEVMRGAHKFGFDAFEFSFDSLEQAKWLLDQDIPIIADIQSFNHPGKGHYVVITSIDNQGVHLMDPNTPGNQRTISHEEMEERWWDRAMAPPHDPMVKWGIVILPPERR